MGEVIPFPGKWRAAKLAPKDVPGVWFCPPNFVAFMVSSGPDAVWWDMTTGKRIDNREYPRPKDGMTHWSPLFDPPST